MKIMPLSAESSTWGSFTKRIERKAQSPTQQLQGVQQWGEGTGRLVTGWASSEGRVSLGSSSNAIAFWVCQKLGTGPFEKT